MAKLLKIRICKFLDIYLMCTVASSAHSNNSKPTKTPKPIKIWAFLKIKPTALGFLEKNLVSTTISAVSTIQLQHEKNFPVAVLHLCKLPNTVTSTQRHGGLSQILTLEAVYPASYLQELAQLTMQLQPACEWHHCRRRPSSVGISWHFACVHRPPGLMHTITFTVQYHSPVNHSHRHFPPRTVPHAAVTDVLHTSTEMKYGCITVQQCNAMQQKM